MLVVLVPRMGLLGPDDRSLATCSPWTATETGGPHQALAGEDKEARLPVLDEMALFVQVPLHQDGEAVGGAAQEVACSSGGEAGEAGRGGAGPHTHCR